MNWKNRLTNYNFWISIFSAVLLILQAFNIEFDIAYVNEIFTAILGLLVVIGIISDPTKTATKSTKEETTKVTTKEEQKIEADANEELETKIEDDLKLQTAKQTETKENQLTSENVLPTFNEDEADNVNTKNDIQVLLTKIQTDLDEKIKKLEQLNAQTQMQMDLQKSNEVTEKTNEIVSVEEKPSPAVAEMANPYIDVIN